MKNATCHIEVPKRTSGHQIQLASMTQKLTSYHCSFPCQPFHLAVNTLFSCVEDRNLSKVVTVVQAEAFADEMINQHEAELQFPTLRPKATSSKANEQQGLGGESKKFAVPPSKLFFPCESGSAVEQSLKLGAIRIVVKSLTKESRSKGWISLASPATGHPDRTR